MKRISLLTLIAAFAMVPGIARADISNMDIGGDMMMMFFWGDNLEDFNDSGTVQDEEREFFRTEAHLWFQADLEDNVMARISVEADRDWDGNDNNNDLDRAAAADLDVFLEEAYIQIANIYDTSLSIMAGRQFLNFGDNENADDFNGYWGGSFWFGDGIDSSPAELQDLGTWEVDPFDAIVLEWDLDTAIIDVFYGAQNEDTSGQDLDVQYYGINGSYIGWEGHQLDVYFLYDSLDFDKHPAGDLGEINDFLLGVRLAGDCIPDELSYKAEVAYHFGDIEDSFGVFGLGTDPTQDGDIDGFGVEVGINYHPDMDYNPEIGFIYTWLEGDDNNPMDEDFEGFGAVFENKYYGQIANDFVNTNAHIFHLTAGADLNEQWSLDSDWYYFLLDEDDTFHLEGTLPGLAKNDDLGFEWDLQLNYTFNESVGAFGGAGVFFPGDAIDDLTMGCDDEAYF
ncbi:MAG: alginate export family protein, partial [bacterium]